MTRYRIRREDWFEDDPSAKNYVDPLSTKRPRKSAWHIYQDQKIILRCRGNRNSNTQVAAAVDTFGIFPIHDFYCVKPRDLAISASIEGLPGKNPDAKLLALDWLAALLNSSLARAWFAVWSSSRGIQDEVVKDFPLPNHFDPQIPTIAREIFACNNGAFGDLFNRIDELVRRCYGISTADWSRIINFSESIVTNPWAEAARTAHEARGEIYRRLSGTVMRIDVTGQRVTLDLPFLQCDPERGLDVPLPKEMPGWALQEGVDFTCRAPESCKNADDFLDPWVLRDFRAFPYQYLETEILERLTGFRNKDS